MAIVTDGFSWYQYKGAEKPIYDSNRIAFSEIIEGIDIKADVICAIFPICSIDIHRSTWRYLNVSEANNGNGLTFHSSRGG
jgi:hypothetical protein